MPFEEPQGKEVEMTLGYGEQTDPGTGKPFFHHGIDFNARYYRLSAVASGIVSGVGNDPVHGICQTIRYGEYEVTYGHLSNVFAQFGQRVKAGQTVALSVKTDYDKDKREIEELMLRFLPYYMEDLQRGVYVLPEHTEQSLRHIFTMGAMREYFYENMPSMANPLGLGHKSIPLVSKVQNLLIADFLHYLALRHNVYLSTMSGDIKKNSMTKP